MRVFWGKNEFVCCVYIRWEKLQCSAGRVAHFQILSNARFTRGPLFAKPIFFIHDCVTETHCLAFSVFFTTWKEKNKKHTIMFFKGQSEVLWWDARWVHCTFPLQNRWIPVWPPLYGLREKFVLTIVPRFTEALPPELLEGIHTPPTCFVLLQPFKLEWRFSRVGKVEISSRCGLMHLIMQWSL